MSSDKRINPKQSQSEGSLEKTENKASLVFGALLGTEDIWKPLSFETRKTRQFWKEQKGDVQTELDYGWWGQSMPAKGR